MTRVVHILRFGFSLCGTMGVRVPRAWPEGHVWVRFEEREEVEGSERCAECYRAVANQDPPS